jgi:hypothetical protein
MLPQQNYVAEISNTKKSKVRNIIALIISKKIPCTISPANDSFPFYYPPHILPNFPIVYPPILEPPKPIYPKFN